MIKITSGGASFPAKDASCASVLAAVNEWQDYLHATTATLGLGYYHTCSADPVDSGSTITGNQKTAAATATTMTLTTVGSPTGGDLGLNAYQLPDLLVTIAIVVLFALGVNAGLKR